jgi:tetratricopeptide (TPR) repeat protein
LQTGPIGHNLPRMKKVPSLLNERVRVSLIVGISVGCLLGTPMTVARADDAPGGASRTAEQYAEDLNKVGSGLLDQLKTAATAEAASALETRIWDTWMRSGDPEADKLMQQGTVYMRTGRLEIALAAFDALVQRRPAFAEGWNKRATLHYMMGNFEASLADIDKVLALVPRHFGALAGIGLIKLAQGDRPAALSAYRRVLEVSPFSAGAKESVEALSKELEGDPI